MKLPMSAVALFAGLCTALAGTAAMAGEAGTSLVKVGAASVVYNNKSTELRGDLTPEGITAAAEDHTVASFTYDYFVTDNWSVQFAGGLPPTVTLKATGTATELGQVGESKALLPAVVGLYHLDFTDRLSGYLGAGLNFSRFTDSKIYESYETAFGGESKGKIEDAVGGVFKVGASYALNDNWMVDAAYSRYWITADAKVTTATPGVGDVTRSISVDVDPDIFSLSVGYKF
ncbi:outer membrane beta-barrel protein [Microbulbifer bruguierae]|uniref:Outer membrane beta-barrel protein n=1 Tax=Microbulbifer bruguierae TaxID=3029061 RepID=A0ABY8NBV2_9GAMM|nr:OmpW family outer membrane protein [Microbulbifer bruguierae]WGL15879.1 outer membrane beta-barrel protein [Microbulbifer bruguierae]